MNWLAVEGTQPGGHTPSGRSRNSTLDSGRAVADADTPSLEVAPCVHAAAVPLCAEVGGSADVAIGDWDDLFSAVEARLTATVGELFAALPKTSASIAANRIRESVLECVAALHQLHATVTHELARRERLLLGLTDSRTAPAEARAECAGLESPS